MAVGNWDDHHLLRRQPEREGASVVFHQDADEALQRAVDCAVDGDWPNALPCLVGVGEVESLRKHHKVNLHGGGLPFAPERIANDDVDLRRIERAVAGIQAPLRARVAQRLLDH